MSDEMTGPYVGPTPPLSGSHFAPGELLAGRYRVVAPLGRGGMGEVYRADDLTLGQPVALKFLPPHLRSDPDRLARFRKEVAAARRVSHPNVCRVYDIAEYDGQPFLTMEFVDGEDLASLLKRVGRLPEEKGVEIARQLCGALAAVHDQGLLHRDLKPANVMLDGRGRVRLTDFGLAAASADLSATEMRSGTPLYQAPEQLAGREVTVRSDLFALGLVLYELFTGRKAFTGTERDTTPSRPSSHVTGLSPAVERVILRCLELDPAKRPRSATEVLVALPGGDPLAAAVAAGETPSPQLVADAGEVGLIKPWVGLLLLGGLVLMLAAAFALAPAATLHGALPALASPADQERIARQSLDQLGAEAGHDTAAGYRYDGGTVQLIRQRAAGAKRFPHLRGGRTYALTYFYRRSPAALGTRQNLGIGQPDEPPPTRSGMAGVRLDGAGRLLEFYRIPGPEFEPSAANAPQPVWGPLLEAARLQGTTVTPTPPRWTPPMFADSRAAWDVTDADGVPYHAEAAALRGRPVWFRLAHDQERTAEAAPPSGPSDLAAVVFFLILGGAGLLAVRNLIRGRGDVRGTVLTVALTSAGSLIGWGTVTRLPASGDAWFNVMVGVIGYTGLMGLFVGACYLALEPVARRRWPWYLSAWSRFLAGRVRDPLVGRDTLLGLFVGAVALVMSWVSLVLVRWVTQDPSGLNTSWSVAIDQGTISLAGETVSGAIQSGLYGFGFFLLVLLVVRKVWLAWLAFVALMTLLWMPINAPSADQPLALVCWLLLTAVRYGLLTFVAARFGLLSTCAAALSVYLLLGAPLTTATGAWHFWYGAGPALVILALALYAFYTATGGKRLLTGGFFGDE